MGGGGFIVARYLVMTAKFERAAEAKIIISEQTEAD